MIRIGANGRRRHVHERDAHDAIVEQLERITIVECVAALDAEPCGMFSGGHGRAVVIRGLDERDIGRAFEDRGQPVAVLDEHSCTPARPTKRVGRDHPDAAGDPGLSEPGQVDLTVDGCAERTVAVALRQVITEHAIPDERIDVEYRERQRGSAR
jgi:hypothetical protein